MKPVIALRVGDETLAVSTYHFMLELSACGRGFITAQVDGDCTGQLVRLDLGINDVTYRWFTGYVERSGPAENGWQRLFVRELVGGLSATVPVSLQHPTLRDVCDAVSALTGLEFVLPEADYVTTQIPHFKSSGSGYLLLEQLAGAFSIPDYCWYQLPDGTVFAGSFEHSRFAGSPLTIPEEFMKRGIAGNALEMPFIPAIRPGSVINDQRITQVEAADETMTLRWTLLNSRGQPAWDPPEKRRIDKVYPELAAGLHLPKVARVTGPTDSAVLGDIADPFRPRYAVNVQLLNADGSDSDTPELIAVPLPVPLAGAEGGIYQFPEEGTVVELGFIDGRADKPVVRQTLQDGQSLPAISPGEQLQQFRAGVSQRVTPDGSWQRDTDQTIAETSRTRNVISDEENRTTTTRSVTILASDTLTVVGTRTLMAGATVQVADGPWSVVAAGKITQQGPERESLIDGDDTTTVRGTLTEKITGIRKSVAAAHHLLAPSVVIGSEDTNLMRLFTDTLDVLETLARQTAEHTHNNTGTPTNSNAISATAEQPQALRERYESYIG
ncbi:TPA: hypothetical protein KE741_003118 [Raoultella ornithinolytica]|nr:hypothetical protein [Raoultella ornithinolytica]